MALKIPQYASPTIRGFLLRKEALKAGPSLGKLTSVNVTVTAPPISVKNVNICWSLAALNINSIRTPPHIEPATSRIPPPLPVPKIIELPQTITNVSYEDQTPTKSIEEPSAAQVVDKQAARLIVIRRHKMKKHKLKKLRKRMKFEFLKIRQKREMKREKAFQALLIEKINLAQSFDPAKYAAEKIAKSKEVELPPVWHGVKYPEWVIKMLLEQEEKKKKEKESDEKRRASMSPYVKDYLKNLPK